MRANTRPSPAPAKISRKPGGAFSCYGGQLTGVTLETVKGKLTVQAWRAKGWPKDAWSIATFILAGTPGGKSKLVFTQAGVPRSALKGITQGWKSHYWDAMKAYIKAAK